MSSYHFGTNYSEKWNNRCFALVLILTSKRHFSRKISQKRFVPIRKQKKWLYIHFGNPYFLPWHSVWKSIRSKIQQFCDCINWSPFGILMAGWATWCCAACFCQQARSSQRYECCWDHWQAWITLPAPATLVSNKWLSAQVHLHLGKLLLLWIHIDMQPGLVVTCESFILTCNQV